MHFKRDGVDGWGKKVAVLTWRNFWTLTTSSSVVELVRMEGWGNRRLDWGNPSRYSSQRARSCARLHSLRTVAIFQLNINREIAIPVNARGVATCNDTTKASYRPATMSRHGIAATITQPPLTKWGQEQVAVFKNVPHEYIVLWGATGRAVSSKKSQNQYR